MSICQVTRKNCRLLRIRQKDSMRNDQLLVVLVGGSPVACVPGPIYWQPGISEHWSVVVLTTELQCEMIYHPSTSRRLNKQTKVDVVKRLQLRRNLHSERTMMMSPAIEMIVFFYVYKSRHLKKKES